MTESLSQDKFKAGLISEGTTTVPTPVNATDAATKGYVDAHAGAVDPHPVYLKPSEVIAGSNITVDTTTTPGSVIIVGQVESSSGPTGPTGPPTAVYIQPDTPSFAVPPPYYPLWVDTDATAGQAQQYVLSSGDEMTGPLAGPAFLMIGDIPPPARKMLESDDPIPLLEQSPYEGNLTATRDWVRENVSGGSGTSDHGALTGLADDDHPQYLTQGRGDARYLQPSEIIAGTNVSVDTATTPGSVIINAAGGGGGGVTDHGALTGLGDDDHPQYALADGSRGTFEVAGAVAAHAAEADPHPNYLTAAEAPQPGGVPQNTNALAASAGTSALYSREDHKHYTQVGPPVALGATIANGTSNFMARADHVHPYPTAAQVGALTQGQADALYAPKVVISTSEPVAPAPGTIWVPEG